MKYSEPFLLSSTGSTRATAYGFSNKSVTLDGKTHVVWLDAVAKVCGRTYDHATQQWSEAQYYFDGCDNHTSPALTVDKEGHLHLVYGPHGWWGGWNMGCFKWVKSERPNDITAWANEQQFGYNATYASMVHLPQGFDAIVYRGGDSPSSLMFQRQRSQGGWSSARELVRQEIKPQYTHYSAVVTCDGDGTIYVAGHLYNVEGNPVTAPAHMRRTFGIVLLKSHDMGETWSSISGEPVVIPTLYQPSIAIPPIYPYDADWRIAGLALDSKRSLYSLTYSPQTVWPEIFLTRWHNGQPHIIDVAPFLPPGWQAVDATFTTDMRDRIHVVVSALPAARVSDEKAWGHPLSEIFHLVSDDDGQTFLCNQLSETDESTPNWLPSISLAGVYNPVENPVILYTHGVAGVGCSPSTPTDVYCVLTRS